VRGGSQDQNLTLLDEATIYNAGHLLNFFSVFNADALRSASLLKTPTAGRGGRLSSVLDLTSRDGDPDTLRVRVGLGIIASRVLVEGPIKPHPPTLLRSTQDKLSPKGEGQSGRKDTVSLPSPSGEGPGVRL
jgi:hypothetical protein